MAKKPKTPLSVETLKHPDATRKNIPTAEYQSVMAKSEQTPIQVAYARRNRDLDPQLVWRGKDEQDWSDLVVNAPPLYIQEKVQPKALIDELRRRSEQSVRDQSGSMADLFSDFNGIPEGADKTDFYQHEGHWQNRMILGDSLQVMASLAEREGLRGRVQCIYFDPPYGIKFNSNFQWSTTSRDVKDGKADHITREPEQVKAFRDTWRDGIHSYLTYLRDRLTVARDLLTESGSIFVQIGDENVHRVRALMDEVFSDNNFVVQITVVKTSGLAASSRISASTDYILWYTKDSSSIKYRSLLKSKNLDGEEGVNFRYVRDDAGVANRVTSHDSISPDTAYRVVDLTKPGPGAKYVFNFQGRNYESGGRWWGTTIGNMTRVMKAGRLEKVGNSIGFLRAWQDYNATPIDNVWSDTGTGGFLEPKIYVVQTIQKIIQRCVLMATDPGDLVLDPTCGSGTTAFVAEQWGRRWITIDTSRVALALARARIMGARYPFYLLADSREGQQKEGEVTRTAPSTQATHGNIRHGFVYERVPHITLKSIANNAEIDVIWDQWQAKLEPLRENLNAALKKTWQEWEIPREAEAKWPDAAKKLHADWWQGRIARQQEIDKSISAKAEFEYLYDKPYEDKKKVRVAGPFTVESLSPHRVLGVDENDELIDEVKNSGAERDFVDIILDTLRVSGVQQARKDNKIDFTALHPWPGRMVCAEGKYMEGDAEKRAAIFIGPEFGTVSRPDLVEAAREAADADFDVLIACAFNFDAHSTDFDKLGRIPVLKARMNADLHMAEDLKNTGKGNLFVVFGEPDIEILDAGPKGLPGQIRLQVKGVDVFKPSTGEVESSNPDDIACWFIDTDYNEESFFVKHAYFLGANDPYKSLKTTLKAEIDQDAWATLNSDTSRPFDKPLSGRIAVKVINHLGDEVMKVFKIS
jgi:adenine-specific DNA-methyltransferase